MLAGVARLELVFNFDVSNLFAMVFYSLMMAWSFPSLIRGALQEFGCLMM